MGKCEHGLTSKECYVCASPKHGEQRKPEALRLAENLTAPWALRTASAMEAAAELLRLHAENETLRKQHLDAHRNSSTIFAALVQISLLTHLGGEVAEYGDVVEAVRQMRDRMISEGWRQCAQGQKTTQFCGMVEQEREACAKVCDELADRDKLSNYYRIAARAIRARGDEDGNPSFG